MSSTAFRCIAKWNQFQPIPANQLLHRVVLQVWLHAFAIAGVTCFGTGILRWIGPAGSFAVTGKNSVKDLSVLDVGEVTSDSNALTFAPSAVCGGSVVRHNVLTKQENRDCPRLR